MYKFLFPSIIGTLALLLLFLSFQTPGKAETFNDSPFFERALFLEKELCIRTAPEEKRSECLGKASTFAPSSKEDLMKKTRKLLDKVTPLRVRDAVLPPFVDNFYGSLYLDEALLFHQDIQNCYLNVGTDFLVNFYLDKAMGNQESDHEVDNAINNKEVYNITPLGVGHCLNVYEDKMEPLDTALRAAFAKSGVAHTGVTQMVGERMLNEYFDFSAYLERYTALSFDPRIPTELMNLSQSSLTEIKEQHTKNRTKTITERDIAKKTMLGSLEALSNLEQTYPLHVQYKKLIYRSDLLRSELRNLRLYAKQLNNKFTNASVTGGKP